MNFTSIDRSFRKNENGSATIEGIICVSLFLSVVMILILSMRFMEIYNEIQISFYETTIQVSRYKPVEDISVQTLKTIVRKKFDDDNPVFAHTIPFIETIVKEKISASYIESQVFERLNEKGLKTKYVKNLKVQFSESNGDNRMANVTLNYDYLIPILGGYKYRVSHTLEKEIWQLALLDHSGNDGSSNSLEPIYVTKTGTRYHYQGCMYLRKSQRAITIDQALEEHYSPCKICILNGGW